MGEFYLLGFWISLIIGLIKIVISLSVINSRRAANLEKVSLYYHPMSGQFIEKEFSWWSFAWLVVWMLILAPIFSWLSVVSAAYSFVSHHTNKTEVPEGLKKIHYQIANLNLSKEQMLSLLRESQSFLAPKDSKVAESTLDNLIAEPDIERPRLDIDNSGFRASWEIDVIHKRIIFDSKTPDYDVITDAIMEYKIEQTNVFIRTLHERERTYTEEYIHIQDNVVIESTIREECKNNRFMKFDELIAKYSKEVEWRPVEFHKLKFLILQNHPEVLPSVEFRKYARQELERIKNGRLKFETEADKFGCYLLDEADSCSFKFKEELGDKFNKEIEELFSEKGFQQFGVTRLEVQNSPMIINYLESILK